MNSITPKKKVYSDLPTGEKMADMARFLQEHKAQNAKRYFSLRIVLLHVSKEKRKNML